MLVVPLVGADDRAATVAWLLCVARAAVDEATSKRHRGQWAQFAAQLEHLIKVAAPDVDSADATTELLALLDGLACSVAVEPGRVSADLAEHIARSHVRRLTGEAVADPPQPRDPA